MRTRGGSRLTRLARASISAAFSALVVSVVLIGTPASAHDTDLVDPADTSGRMDIGTVMLEHSPERARWAISMIPKWSINQAWDQGFVIVDLDTKGNSKVDYYVLAYSDGRHYKGGLYEDRDSGKDRRISKVSAKKTDAHTAVVSLDLSKVQIDPLRTEWFWSVRTLWLGGHCRRVCIDLAPDAGLVTQPVEAPPTMAPIPDLGDSAPERQPSSANPEGIDLPRTTR